MVIPLITRGDAPPDASPSGRDRLARAAHLGAARLLAASFLIEVRFDPRLGFALRAAVVLTVLALAARAWRLPQLPGLHRKVIWVAAWLLPLGYVGAAIWPQYRMAALHLVFLGFAAMALAVGVHVTLAHGGYQRLVRQPPAPVVVMSVLLALALVARVLVNTDPARMWLWMGLASGAFLIATLAWAAVTLPRTWREARE